MRRCEIEFLGGGRRQCLLRIRLPQTLLAIIYNYKDRPPTARLMVVDEILFVSLALVLAYIVVFAIPAG